MVEKVQTLIEQLEQLEELLLEGSRVPFRGGVLINDQEALDAFKELTLVEGIMPALETAHALAYVKKIAPAMDSEKVIVVNVSGRGDKDIKTVANIEGIEL